MAKKLYRYQQKALKWARPQNHVAFYLEMRLGKTLLAIRWAEDKSLQKILVVCPLSVVWTWQAELFSELLSSTILIGSPKQKRELLADQDSRWYITNYESLYIGQQEKRRLVPSIISTLPWDGVILDESTHVRNPKAIRTKICRKYFKGAPIKGVLSGLPNPEGSLDYFEQLAFLDGEFLDCDNYWKFRLKYFHQGYNQWNWIPNKGAISKIKQEVQKKAFVLSRKQAKIGSKKIFETRFVELPPKVFKAYRELEKDFVLGENTTKWIISQQVWLARLAGGQPEQSEFCSDHKFRELIDVLEGELSQEQVVIWFRFNRELIYAHTNLLNKKITNDFITGETDINERQRTMKRFKKGDFRILLMQLKCGKFGVDYSAASTAIYCSNSFEHEERSQSEDRIISPQKKEPVLILDILAKDTIDEDIYKSLKTKGMNSKIFMSKIIENLKKRVGKC